MCYENIAGVSSVNRPINKIEQPENGSSSVKPNKGGKRADESEEARLEVEKEKLVTSLLWIPTTSDSSVKCRIPVPNEDLLNQNLNLNEIPR